MDKPAVTVLPDQSILAAAEADPAIMLAMEAGLATAASARGCGLIDAIPAGDLAAWDGRDELALVGRRS